MRKVKDFFWTLVITKYCGYEIVIPPLWAAETLSPQSVVTTNISLPPLIDGQCIIANCHAFLDAFPQKRGIHLTSCPRATLESSNKKTIRPKWMHYFLRPQRLHRWSPRFTAESSSLGSRCPRLGTSRRHWTNSSPSRSKQEM